MGRIGSTLRFIGGFAILAGLAGVLLPVVGLTLSTLEANNISQGDAAIMAAIGLAVWWVGFKLTDY